MDPKKGVVRGGGPETILYHRSVKGATSGRPMEGPFYRTYKEVGLERSGDGTRSETPSLTSLSSYCWRTMETRVRMEVDYRIQSARPLSLRKPTCFSNVDILLSVDFFRRGSPSP